MSSAALVTVVSGDVYEKFAENLFVSAEAFFNPTEEVDFLMLSGRPGWPDATMYRHHVLVEHMPSTDYVFLCDADMRFEGNVGAEILPPLGISATLHPGYVTMTGDVLPYERRPESSACVYMGGMNYYCGGFVGGTRSAMLRLSTKIAEMVDHDQANGITPTWHDESCLNRALLNVPPQVMLSPSYCYPDNDAYYKTIWRQQYTRKLVALDKTSAERGDR